MLHSRLYYGAYVEISKRLVIINSMSSILTMAIELLFNFWLYQYLIRRITPEEFSLLPVVMSIMIFIPLLTVFFTSGIGRYIIDAYARGDEEGVIRIISSIFPFLTVCALLLLVIGGLGVLNVDRILNIPEGQLSAARLMFALLFITFAYSISALPFQFGFQVKQKFVVSNLLTLARTLTKIGIVFVLLFSSGVWVVWVVVADTASGVVFITVRLMYSRRILPSLKYRVRMFDLSTAKTILSFGLWSFLAQAAISLRLAMNPIILNLFATPMDVTCFHIGSSFRLLKISLYDWIHKSFIPGILPAMSGGVVWFALHLWHPPTTWFKLAAFFSIGAIVYLMVLYILGLDKSKRKDLRRALGKYFAVFQ